MVHHFSFTDLVGGIPTPLKNMSSSVGVIIPNIRKNTNVPNHQPEWFTGKHTCLGWFWYLLIRNVDNPKMRLALLSLEPPICLKTDVASSESGSFEANCNLICWFLWFRLFPQCENPWAELIFVLGYDSLCSIWVINVKTTLKPTFPANMFVDIDIY